MPLPQLEKIGHRGAPKVFTENTMASFDEAIRAGADAVELDVHVTVDGVPVVHHDDTLSARVEPRGLAGGLIARLTAREVAGVLLPCGSPVPTLEAVLERCAGAVRVYVEIKSGAEAAVARTILASNAECAVHGFDHGAVARLGQLAPEIARGILYDRLPVDLTGDIRAAGARDIWPRFTITTAGLVEQAHGLGCRVIPWTVNEAPMARQLARMGVDGICTDHLGIL
jgi:glycerophosphoryl diester phosphodiesterase